MSVRISTEFRNKFAEGFGLRESLRDGRLYLYTGSQPASADDAPTGTLLATFTLSDGTYTAPTQATFLVTLSGSAGSVDTLTLGGSAFNLLGGAISVTPGVQATSADLIAAAINGTQNPWNATAVATSADVITVSMAAWLGAMVNGLTIAHTETTTTVAINGGSSATVGGTGATAGVTAVNGLNFQFPAVAGVLSKESTAWQATAVATGTAGWFRFVAGGSTVDGVDNSDCRFDGACATSGSDLNLSSLSIVSAAVQTISTFTLTIPAS
jgi:hypothetical protein